MESAVCDTLTCMHAMFYFMEEIKCSTGISNISLFFPVQGIRICSKNINTFLLCQVTPSALYT